MTGLGIGEDDPPTNTQQLLLHIYRKLGIVEGQQHLIMDEQTHARTSRERIHKEIEDLTEEIEDLTKRLDTYDDFKHEVHGGLRVARWVGGFVLLVIGTVTVFILKEVWAYVQMTLFHR